MSVHRLVGAIGQHQASDIISQQKPVQFYFDSADNLLKVNKDSFDMLSHINYEAFGGDFNLFTILNNPKHLRS